MASVASASPLSGSGYDYPGDSAGDADDNNNNPWTFVSMPNSGPSPSGGGPGAFFPSPSTSAALGSSWGFIGSNAHSEPAASPLTLDTADLAASGVFDASSFDFSAAASDQQQQQFFMDHLFQTSSDHSNDFFAPASTSGGNPSLLSAQFADLGSLLTPLTTEEQHALSSALDFAIPEGLLLPSADAPPWNPTDLREAVAAASSNYSGSIAGSSPIFVLEDPSAYAISPSPPPPSQKFFPLSSPSVSVSPRASPPLTHIKREDTSSISRTTTAPITIRKVKDARVGKTSSTTKKKPSPSSPHSASSSSSGLSTFLIVTPDSVHAHADKSNPFDCHDALRSTQRGRKGPLASETKQSALRVRRLGACFHCHARKVKCEADRPCRNCQKLRLQVPAAMCWQFDDFDGVLFPEFIRGHFARDEMARFVADNIAGFSGDETCAVELSSAPRFAARLAVKARFFTAKTDEVLRHWHLQPGQGMDDVRARSAVPIGFDPDGPSQRDELRRKTERYVQAIVGETAFADVVADARYTRIPRTVVRIVQEYAQRTDNAMVKRALSIYAMHYVMTHHLTLTPETVVSLAGTGRAVPQGVPHMTSRVLSRQIKAVMDDVMRQEMTRLFKSFGSTLKPKERKGWAPCLAAFLVLCLFMETVEAAADTFVVSENQICLQTREAPRWQRAFALEKNAEIENMPFKQVAFQFHQLYQTHSRDAGSRSFNPLLDDACLEPGELDRDAAAMVMQLRRLLEEPNCECSWGVPSSVPVLTSVVMIGGELDFLTMDPVFPSQDKFPIRNLAVNYTGRLAAKFLLSFIDERYIIERNDC